MDKTAGAAVAQAASTVLITLAAGQFLMTLDSSVMNVAIATVAEDVGTTITGIQTAITLYTLVMAMLMITGGKIGSMIGRRRAFAIGCVIYGLGSLTTALAPNLPVLILGWSVLEGIGAALILPAIVALVAGNFVAADRPRAYGLVSGAGGIAVAVGPLIGGFATTYFSWRWVFVGEVARRARDPAAGSAGRRRTTGERGRFDLVGAVLVAVGLGVAVFGVLRSSEWGWVTPKPDGPVVVGHVPDHLADPRRPAGRLAVPGVGVPRAGARAGAVGAAGAVRQPSDDRRAADVLPALPRAGRAVLHDPAVPVGLAGPVRAGHRATDPAAVDHAARRGRRHPAVLSHRFAAAGGPLRAAGDVPGCGRPARRRWTPTRTPGSSRCRCCWPGWGSARSPRSWAR